VLNRLAISGDCDHSRSADAGVERDEGGPSKEEKEEPSRDANSGTDFPPRISGQDFGR
jgi:hypothetical protein